jgi:hypothetical protein
VGIFKALGAVAFAALAVTVLCAAGSASATILCEVKEVEEGCPVQSIAPVPSPIEAELKEGTSATFKGTIEIVCKKSAMSGKNTEEVDGATEPLIGTVTAMTFAECSGCKTVEALNLPYKSSLVPGEKEGNGVFTLESSGKGQPSFKAGGCPFGATCTFGAKALKFNFEGGNPGALKAETVLGFESGTSEFLCGKTGTQIFDYRPMPAGPGPPILILPSAILCEENKRACPPTKTYPINSVIEATLNTGEKAQWTDGAGLTIECKKSQLLGKTTTRAGVYGELIPTFSECGLCEVELRHLNPNGKYAIRISAVGIKGKGEMVVFDMSVKLRCKDGMGNITVECIYGLAKPSLKTIVGGTPNATLFVNTTFDREGGTCGITATWTGNYTFEKPKPLWIF